MKNSLRLYFVFSLIIGISISILQKMKVEIPNFINNYVNDFLIIPIILTICLFILKRTKNNKNYQLPLALILYLCLLYSVLFEYVFPKYLVRYTGDWIDVFLYFLSGLLFYKLQQSE